MTLLDVVVLSLVATVVINVTTIFVTVLVRAFRGRRRRLQRARVAQWEPVLDRTIGTGAPPRALIRARGEDREVVAMLLVELLVTLQGADRQRMSRLAEDLGLVDHDVRRVTSRRPRERARAAERLGHYGTCEHIDVLSGLLQDEEETVRAVAARALSRIGGVGAAEALAAQLTSPSELTGLRMAENLERIGAPALGPLVAVLDSTEAADRRGQVLAARALGNLRAGEARPALRQAVRRHWNTDLRAQATLALGKIGDPDDIPVILEAGGDTSWPVRVQAANALGAIGDISTIPTLERLAQDTAWWARLSASRALGNMGPAGERALVAMLDSADPFARDRAAATLQERGIDVSSEEPRHRSAGQPMGAG